MARRARVKKAGRSSGLQQLYDAGLPAVPAVPAKEPKAKTKG